MIDIGEIVEYWCDGRIETGEIVQQIKDDKGKLICYIITFGWKHETAPLKSVYPEHLVE